MALTNPGRKAPPRMAPEEKAEKEKPSLKDAKKPHF